MSRRSSPSQFRFFHLRNLTLPKLALGINLVVILWGVVVRATGSGAGCGEHWPLCDGQVVPFTPHISTLIEYGHRLSSGLALLVVLALTVWAYRQRKSNQAVWNWSLLSLFFILMEAAIGAGLVLFGLVADNQSGIRAVVISVHLVNTLLLLAALVGVNFSEQKPQSSLPLNCVNARWSLAALLLFFLLATSGAITALGDTLFPASSLAEGIQQDFQLGAHFLVKLRVIHPLLAILTGIFLLLVGDRFQSPSLITLTLLAWVVGVLNLLLLAPVWLQVIHLLMTDLIWINLVWIILRLSRGNPVTLLRKL